MNCPACQEKCCNRLLHELRNGNVSLSYVAKEFKAGRINDDLINRLSFEIARIDKALKHCGRVCE